MTAYKIKIDSVREERARRMVLNTSCWPNVTHICMKQMVEPMKFGICQVATPDRIEIVNYRGEPEFKLVYNGIDALVADNWTVD